MEGEICNYDKFGYCKFKKECIREHLKEECEDLADCKHIKTCNKRHPKRCKNYVSKNACRFESDCAYSHKKSKESIEKDMLKEKVDTLEKTVSEMEIKLKNFEEELNEIKRDKFRKEQIDNKGLNSEKKADTGKDAALQDINLRKVSEPKQNSLECQGSKAKTKETKKPVFIFGAEARKSVLEEGKSNEIGKSSKLMKCDQCDYSCERQNTLKKHTNTKHTVQKCSLCSEEFTTSMDLISHIAIEQHDEEEACSLELQSTPKSGKEKEDLEFDELMLEGYL